MSVSTSHSRHPLQKATQFSGSGNYPFFTKGPRRAESRLIFCTSPHTHTHTHTHDADFTRLCRVLGSRRVPPGSLSHCCESAPHVVLGAARRPCVLVQRMTRSDALVDRVREARQRRLVVKALVWLAVALTVARRAHYGAVCRRQRSPNSSL